MQMLYRHKYSRKDNLVPKNIQRASDHSTSINPEVPSSPSKSLVLEKTWACYPFFFFAIWIFLASCLQCKTPTCKSQISVISHRILQSPWCPLLWRSYCISASRTWKSKLTLTSSTIPCCSQLLPVSRKSGPHHAHRNAFKGSCFHVVMEMWSADIIFSSSSLSRFWHHRSNFVGDLDQNLVIVFIIISIIP